MFANRLTLAAWRTPVLLSRQTRELAAYVRRWQARPRSGCVHECSMLVGHDNG
jgi:hypothetical protein